MISDAIINLVESGVVTGARKTRDTGLVTAGAALGSDRLWRFLDRNPTIQLMPTSYTHRADVLRSLGPLVSINSALEVDLTGQVNAEEIAGRQLGAVGGQGDFMRAAQDSGGRSILALPARNTAGKSTIVARLHGPVTTARSDVDVVVTEFGAAWLRGVDLAGRCRLLTELAHPDDRSQLELACEHTRRRPHHVTTGGRMELPTAPTTRAIEMDDGIIRPRIHHALLKTTRYKDMRDWYYAVLGMTVQYEFSPDYPNGTGAFMSNDAGNHRLVLFSPPTVTDDPDRIGHTGLHHWAFEYDSLDDLLSTYLRLKSLDIAPGHAVNHGPVTSFYYVDPDGNNVELFVDNFNDTELSTKFFREAPEFRSDPVGPAINPDRLVEARATGLSPLEIHHRSYEGEYPPSPDQEWEVGIPGVELENVRRA
jgi:catechol 2,3-dioxygenase-like lactoylglutathione lyase family enzyme